MKKIFLILAVLTLGSLSLAATDSSDTSTKVQESSSSADKALGTTDSTGGVTDSTGATGDTSSLGSTDNDTGALNSTDSMGYRDSDVNNGNLTKAQDEHTPETTDISKPSLAKREKSRTLRSRTVYPSDIDTERAPSSGADKSGLHKPNDHTSSLPSDDGSSDSQ
jgi:hypothetical protein